MCAFSCWNYGSPWRLSCFALFVFTFCLLSGTIVSSRSDNNGCSAVKNIWKSKGFGESQQVPPSPIQADHLSVCGASTSTTCCTRQMESKLTTHSRQQFASLLSDKLNGIRAGFQTRSSAFEDFCTELVEKSGRELHNMFTRTYGIIYQQNSHVFSELFRDLRAYFRGDDHDLSDVLDAFFSSLLLRMFTLLNGQYVFDERYLGCISERSQELTPFGDVPHKIGLQVKRAFVAARTFRHGLVVASDVIGSLSKMELSSSCQKAITRMLYCPYCRGVTSGIRPCSGMCLNVVRGCLAHHPEFNTAWAGFIESMLKVADRLDGPFSIENVLEPMDVKISEAIMNFQENAEAVTSKVFQVCGQPNLGVRSKRNSETGKKRKGARTTTAMPPRNASTTTVGFQAAGGQGSSSEDTSRAAPSGKRPAQNRTSTVSTTPAAAVAVNKTGDSPRVPLVATDDVTESSIMKSLDSTATSTTSSVGVVRQSASNGTIPSVTLGRVVDRVRPATTSTPMPTTSTSTTVPTTRSTSTTAATTTTTRRSAQVATTVAIRRSAKTTTKMPVVAGRRRAGSRGTPRTPAAAVPSSGRDDVRSSEGRSGAGSETSHTALERMMLEIRSTLTDSQGFLTAVPERMCAGVAAPPSEETRCWNGTSRSRYTAVVVDMATDSQQNNREVQLDTRRTSIIINQAVLQLKHIADKLKKAYNGDSVDWSDDGESDDEDAGIEGDDEDGYDNEGSGSGNGEMETRPTRNRFEGSGGMGGVPQRKPPPPYQGIRNMDERPHDTISRPHHGYPYNMPSTRRPLPPIFVVPTTSPKRIVYVTSRPKATQRQYVPNSAPTSTTTVNHLVPFVVGIFGFVNVTIRLRWYCW